MSTPTDLSKMRESLANAFQQHADACATYDLRNAEYIEATAKGDDAKADKLQIEIEKARRQIDRLELRRDALMREIGSAEEVERAEHGAKLKATADSILARAGKRIADMEPVAAALAKAVDELEKDFADWKEARYFAQQLGATPEGFSNQENDARVNRVFDSMSMSRIRVANIAKELSRISVFQ